MYQRGVSGLCQSVGESGIGICCSGGGIRSAAFNLGALQALDEADVLRRRRLPVRRVGRVVHRLGLRGHQPLQRRGGPRGRAPLRPRVARGGVGPQPLLVPHQQRDRHGAPRGRGGGRPARQPRLLHRAAVDRGRARSAGSTPGGSRACGCRAIAPPACRPDAAWAAGCYDHVGLTGPRAVGAHRRRPRPRRGRAGHRRAHVPARVAAAPHPAAGGGPAGGGGRARRPGHAGAARADRVHPQRAGRAPRDGPGRRLDGRRVVERQGRRPTSASSPPSAGRRRCSPWSSRSAARCGRRRSPAAGPSPRRRRGHSGSRAVSAASPTPSSAP